MALLSYLIASLNSYIFKTCSELLGIYLSEQAEKRRNYDEHKMKKDLYDELFQYTHAHWLY